jgi:glycosyltransferase involved in cell wall biosynthesis
MKTIVLINNYNYSVYLSQCIDSVLAQSVKPSKILVIDDGSTDDSLAILDEYCLDNPLIEVVKKKNAGQLSCFNVAAEKIDDVDLLFLLDSDDLYPPDYIEMVLKNHDINVDVFIFETIIFKNGDINLESSLIDDSIPFIFHASSSITRAERVWIGSPTSAMVVKGSCFKAIFPYDDEKSWRTRADDVLVYSSSILGFVKKYIPSVAVMYRTHGSNHFYGRIPDRAHIIRREFALEKLFVTMCRRSNIALRGSYATSCAEVFGCPQKIRRRFSIPSPLKLTLRKRVEQLVYFFGIRVI